MFKDHQVNHIAQYQEPKVCPDIVFLTPDVILALPKLQEDWEYNSKLISTDDLVHYLLKLPDLLLMMTEIKTDLAFHKILCNGFMLATLLDSKGLQPANVDNAHATPVASP